jgi:DNA-binding NarL/FixJ family response regulator
VVNERRRISEREKQIGALFAQDLDTRQIAARLGIARTTVCTHMHNLYIKLELRGICQLTHYALAHGWIENLFQNGSGESEDQPGRK